LALRSARRFAVIVDQAAVSPGEKFAIVAFRTVRPGGSLSRPLHLGSNTWAWGHPPFELSEWWQNSVGTVRESAFRQCNLFLLAKRASSKVENLDADNELLKNVHWLFQAVLLTACVRVFDVVFLATGSFRDHGVDARQVAELPAPLTTPGAPLDKLAPEALRRAAALVRSIEELDATGGFRRIGRIYSIYQRALTNPDLVERLHQFCRCIEGFILPEIAQTTRQFRSRTELFIGPKHHDLMGQLYDMRSRVEHLRDIQSSGDGCQDERSRRMSVVRECYFLEELSRCCIARFLETREAWPHFRDESVLASFWRTEKAELRRRIWGQPFSMTRLRTRFDEGAVSNADLGL
jgi:hypothetical protein